ncbi:MAG TPA: RNA polymerase subunit sigma-70, partial [Planctomycetaceae bacterium]|nr:RNA polymerase subunit sigma-70 [Planctomycetaceae bacterium]
MQLMDKELDRLITQGKADGFLTFDAVNAYLPDEDVSPEKLDSLMLAIESLGIELVEAAPKSGSGVSKTPKVARPRDTVRPINDFDARDRDEVALSDEHDEERDESGDLVLLQPSDMAKPSDDPIRMYLSQMAEIPLLSREEEISLAKKIEITRRQFRRALLENDYALRATVDVLNQVHKGDLPFDRTIKVSLTERLTKEQILGRMPHNLKSLDTMIEQNKQDFE